MGGSILGQALEEPASGQKEHPEWKPPRPARVCVSPGSREQLQAECLLDMVPLLARCWWDTRPLRGFEWGRRASVLGRKGGGGEQVSPGKSNSSAASDGLWTSERRSCWSAHVWGSCPHQAHLRLVW